MVKNDLDFLISSTSDAELKKIALKLINSERITCNEGILLFEKGELGYLGALANFVRLKINGKNTIFKRNVHLEPSNICVYNCKFCSYSRKTGEEGSWELSLAQIKKILEGLKKKRISEIHITGGVNPGNGFDFYCSLLKLVRQNLPFIHIKAFSAVELDYIFKKSGISYEDGLRELKKCGLNSIPGGGAEIFDEEIRDKICPAKVNSADWLKIHETAHSLGIMSNATMLYGHIENYIHRIDHLERLRQLQDITGGFSTFIPLKFRNANNSFSYIRELPVTEDLKNYAISRIYLDNIPHLKAYWPMIGKSMAQVSLNFGADDIDGTIDDSTKIYTMAGVRGDSNKMTVKEFKKIIKDAGYSPVIETLPNLLKIG